MREAYISPAHNVIGAFVIACSDRIHESAERTSGMVGASSATLVALEQMDRTIDSLARSLQLSHSRTVRIVDGLEADGLARRVRSADDGRAVVVQLSAEGLKLAKTIQQARSEVITGVLAELSEAEVAQLTMLATKVLNRCTSDRAQAHIICRLCDAVACGHSDGCCPVTNAADERESASA